MKNLLKLAVSGILVAVLSGCEMIGQISQELQKPQEPETKCEQYDFLPFNSDVDSTEDIERAIRYNLKLEKLCPDKEFKHRDFVG